MAGHSWDGSSARRILNLWVWDGVQARKVGAAWVRGLIANLKWYPEPLKVLLEDVNLLTHGSVVLEAKIEHWVEGREYILAGHDVGLVIRISASGEVSLLTRGEVDTEARIEHWVDGREFILGAGTASIDKRLAATITALLLDRGEISVEAKVEVSISGREYLNAGESIALVVPLPIVDSVGAINLLNRAYCTVTPGDYCESVRIEYSVNGGAWTYLSPILDTAPNGSSVQSADVTITAGDTIQFRARGYRGDSGTGDFGDWTYSSIV